MLTSRFFARASAAQTCGAAVFLVLGAMQARAEQLTIATYGGGQGDAARAAFAEPYEAATGTEVTVATTENSIGALRAIASSSPAKWDVMDVAMALAVQACKEGLLHPIDRSRLPMGDLAPGSVTECAVSIPKAGSVMVYNKERFGNAPPQSWADFWDVERFPGKRAIVRYVTDATYIALMADGVAPSDVNKVLPEPGTRDRAFAKLEEIRDHIVWVATGTELVQGLVSGEFDLAIGWNARIESANQETGGRFGVVWEAGYALDGSASVVPITAKDPERAMDYIAFSMQPEQQAEYMRHFPYGSVNQQAYDLVSPELKAKLPSSPDKLQHAIVANVDFWSENLADWQKALEAWIAR